MNCENICDTRHLEHRKTSNVLFISSEYEEVLLKDPWLRKRYDQIKLIDDKGRCYHSAESFCYLH